MKFESEYFDDVDDLVSEKDNLLLLHKEKKERVDTVRNFTNGLPTMTDEEAEELGRSEITNHMLGYKNIQAIETQYYSIYSGSNTLAEVIVDTDSPEMDQKLSLIFTKYLNEAIYHRGIFGNLWRSVSGELPIASKAPLMFDANQGWCPRLATNMLFPKGTGYIAEDVTYAFAPRELTMADLNQMSKAVKSGKGKMIDKETIDNMLKALREQIGTDSVRLSGHEGEADEIGDTARDSLSHKDERKTTFNAWWYYEVVHEEDQSYVSATLFTEPCTVGKTDIGQKVLAYRKKAYDTPESWLHFIVADSEIGGVKTIDKARGIAELTYNSDSDREELLNIIVEGTKERAKPKYTVKENADIDAVLQWDPSTDPFAPEGVEEFVVRAPTGDLFAPFEVLGQNSAGLSAGGVSNVGRGGESRNQTLERQKNNGANTNSRISDVYKNLDMLLDEIGNRFLTAKTKRGTEGWQEILWYRSKLDEQIGEKLGLDWRKMIKKDFGRFKFLKIRAIRSIGEGDRGEQLEVADWLMTNITQYAPQKRPFILHTATLAVTKDSDLADFLVSKPDVIISAQRTIAENEYDTIMRRAVSGELISPSVSDIHQDHLGTHIKDLEAHLARHGIAPWKRNDVLGFAGMVEHVGEHLQVLLGNKDTNEEAKLFTKRLQEVVQAAQAVVKEVDEVEGTEESQMSEKERAELELKTAEFQLKARKLGLEEEAFVTLNASRLARQSNIERGQFSRELESARRLNQTDAQIAIQAKQQKSTNEPNN